MLCMHRIGGHNHARELHRLQQGSRRRDLMALSIDRSLRDDDPLLMPKGREQRDRRGVSALGAAHGLSVSSDGEDAQVPMSDPSPGTRIGDGSEGVKQAIDLRGRAGLPRDLRLREEGMGDGISEQPAGIRASGTPQDQSTLPMVGVPAPVAATPTTVAQSDPAGCPVAGALTAGGIDEGLSQQEGIGHSADGQSAESRLRVNAKTLEARWRRGQSGRIRKRTLLTIQCRRCHCRGWQPADPSIPRAARQRGRAETEHRHPLAVQQGDIVDGLANNGAVSPLMLLGHEGIPVLLLFREHRPDEEGAEESIQPAWQMAATTFPCSKVSFTSFTIAGNRRMWSGA